MLRTHPDNGSPNDPSIPFTANVVSMKEIESVEQLKEHQEELENSLGNYVAPFSFGIGLARTIL